MRDDLHKSAPVRAIWRRYLKSCIRDAENGALTERRCLKALVADCHLELTPAFLSELLRRCDGDRRELFGEKFQGVVSAFDLGGSGSVMEEQLLARVRMADHDNGVTEAAVGAALTSVIQDRLDAQIRAITGHVLRDGGRGTGTCLREIFRSAATVNPAELAGTLLSNHGHVPASRSNTSSVSIEENLLKL